MRSIGALPLTLLAGSGQTLQGEFGRLICRRFLSYHRLSETESVPYYSLSQRCYEKLQNCSTGYPRCQARRARLALSGQLDKKRGHLTGCPLLRRFC